jgi:BA14K-like protein
MTTRPEASPDFSRFVALCARGDYSTPHAATWQRAQKMTGEFVMNRSSKILAVALMAAAAPWLVAPAAAAPMSQSLGLQNAVAPSVETVQYRRGWGGGYRGGYRGGGLGIGLGLAAGALVGGILGATGPYGYYGYGPGYAYAPGYGYGYGPGYAYAPGYGYGYGPGYGYAAGYGQGYAGGGEVAYCQQRFRSYDPGSGTYLGFDGLRHSCP